MSEIQTVRSFIRWREPPRFESLSGSSSQAGSVVGAEKGLLELLPGARIIGDVSGREAKRTLLAPLILASSLYPRAVKPVGHFDGRSMTKRFGSGAYAGAEAPGRRL
jgi:hypothetical protein